jgi:3-phenylpropionate/cinnamic acid dioxygenase small subunit
MMPIDRSAVESFLYREARLMDAYQYDEWLALCHDDATYCALQRRRYRPVPQCLGHYDRRGQLRSRISGSRKLTGCGNRRRG